jgi:hypothetical protein
MKNVAAAIVLFSLACPAFAGQPVSASLDTVYDHDVGVANYVRWTRCHVWDTVWFRPIIVNFGRNIEVTTVWEAYFSDDSACIHSELWSTGQMAPGDSIEVVPLIPYRTFDSAGFYVMYACSTLLDDDNPDNNGGRYWAEVTAGDAAIEEVLCPTGDTWLKHRPLLPAIRVANYGGLPVRTWATARFEHACSSFVWMDSVWLELRGGATEVVRFDTWYPPYVGQYRYQFALTATRDTTPWRDLWVVDSVGIEEPPAPPGPVAPGPRLWPNPCRGQVWLEDRGPAPLYAPDGRKVAVLRPGANELRVAPGIYFVRAGPTAIHRLVVTK